MAWSAPKGRPKVFQTRLRTFVKTLRRSSDLRKSGETSEKASTIQNSKARDAAAELQPTRSQPELATTAPLELSLEQGPILKRASTSAPLELSQEQGLLSKRASTEASLREPYGWEAEEERQESSWAISGPVAPKTDDEKPGLSVRVSLRFEDPLGFTYSRNYDSSSTLRVTENLCQGLLRRIDHSCYELITRKDPNASTATKGRGQTKPKRFELTTQISQWGELWATRTYTSYQKDPVTAEAAKEVILSSNRMIGLFLKRHDPEFIWRIGPLHDDLRPLPETQKSPYRCGSIQSLNCVPRSEFIEKSQTFETTPGYKLDLSFTFLNRQGKSLGREPSRRRHVQEQHAQCRFNGGPCQHYLEEASEIALKVTNNFGPDFNHLARSIPSKLVLFEDGNAQDCTEFVDNLQKAIAEARDTADAAIIETNDLDFKIVELRGSGAASRLSLDRVQTGISAVLRGNAATVRYIAWKRGHLILDKTLVAREPKSPTRRWDTSSVTRSKVVNKLRRRVEQDIEMICKDTCSLGDVEGDPPSEPVESAQPTAEASASTAQPAVKNEEHSWPEIPPIGPRLAHAANSVVSGTDLDSSVISQQLSEVERPGSAVHSVTSMNSQSSKIYRDPKTGGRAFPLVPSASTYGVTEMLKQTDPETEDKEPSMPGTTSPTELPIDRVLQGSNSQHASKADSGSMSQQSNTHDGTFAGYHLERENVAPVAEPEDAGVPEAESEPARSTVSSQQSASAENSQQEGLGYQPSTVPSTPSLVSGNGQSPRNSLIVTTPQISGSMSSAELQFMLARRNSEGYAEEAEIPSESIEAEMQHKSIENTPEDASCTVRLVRPKRRPSPLQRDLFMLEASESGEPSSEDAIHTRNTPHPSEEGQNATSSEGTQIDKVGDHDLPIEVPQDANEVASGSVGTRRSNATLVPSPDRGLDAPSFKEITPDILLDPPQSQADSSKYGLNPLKTPSDAGFTFAGSDFAQTREELDFSASAFSSPWSTSTVPGGEYTTLPPPEMRYTNINGELHDVFDDDNEHAIAEDGQLSAPSSPALSTGTFSRPRNASSRTRGSFGSAGLLGLADSQHLLGGGLRRALAMNHSPRRNGSSPLALRTVDFFATQPRRSSMGRELQILKRPSLLNVDASQRPASSGRELETRFLQEGAASHRHHHHHHHDDGEDDGVDTEKPKADPETAMKRSLSSNVLQDFHVREVVKKEKKKKTLQDGARDKDTDTDEEGNEQRPGAGRPRSSSLMFLLAGATLASQMMRPS
ncbi:pt repeat family protein [Apiospora phragmitis]|uniref:Pt repeat family protein n=1 Tax=Apiospora phragmitis TaxID=2905665 RepID=A0ABR1TQS6_9PEZI